MKKIYIIGIGGIGISGIARYFNYYGYNVYGSDSNNSNLINDLKKEGINIFIGEREKIFEKEKFDKIIYTKAISKKQKELKKCIDLKLKKYSYPQILNQITKNKKLITVSGTHGKSTTTSMISIMMKNSIFNVNSIVGSILKEFNNKNVYFSESDFFVIEACEYKRSFLNYKSYIGIITNIEIDHLDYYKDLDDYLDAFKSYVNKIKKGGFLILNGNCNNSKKLIGINQDINHIIIYEKYFECLFLGKKIKKIFFPKIKLKIPGEHILFDAKISYSLGFLLGINKENIISSLENYNGIWRRSEFIGKTINENILISDYGHHPTEIKLTLKAFKERFNKKKNISNFSTSSIQQNF